MSKLSLMIALFQLLHSANSYLHIFGYQSVSPSPMQSFQHLRTPFYSTKTEFAGSGSFCPRSRGKAFAELRINPQRKPARCLDSMSSAPATESQPLFAKDSLILLKGTDPAVVVEEGSEKMEVMLLNKKTKKVRSRP